jgi:hypothetical protein
MKRSELEMIIREELYKYVTTLTEQASLDEKSVPEPYNRKERRRMTRAQIRKRDRIGNALASNEKAVARFQEKHGDDWESYLWAAATNRAMK